MKCHICGGFRRNPTVFASFYRMESYLRHAISAFLAEKPGDHYTIRLVTQLFNAAQQFPGRFTRDEFADLIVNNAGVVVPLASSTAKKAYRSNSFFEEELPYIYSLSEEAAEWLIKAKQEITNIIHYFIQQCVINRPNLTRRLQELKSIIESILQDAQAGLFVAQDGGFDFMSSEEFALLENDMAVLNNTDPYIVNLISFNDVIAAQRGTDGRYFRYLANNSFPMLAYTPVDANDDPAKQLLHKYHAGLLNAMDAFLRLLCPFTNIDILSLRDLTGLENIFVKYQPQQPLYPIVPLGDKVFF